MDHLELGDCARDFGLHRAGDRALLLRRRIQSGVRCGVRMPSHRYWRRVGLFFLAVLRQAQQLSERICGGRAIVARHERVDIDAGIARRFERVRRRHGAALGDVGQRQGVAGKRLAVDRDLHRAAVRKYAGELFAGHARPHANAADVHMHEGRTGLRIEADAAARQAKSDLADLFERDAGDVEVHGAPENMLAVTRHALTAAAQHGVSRRRAVAANDLDRLLGAGLALHFPDQIDQPRIHVGGFAAPPVAQEPVELLDRRIVVAAIALVGDGDVFTGMDVVQRDGAGITLGDGILQPARAEQENQEGEPAGITCACREQSTSLEPRLGNVHWQSRIDALAAPTRGLNRAVTLTHC